MAQIEFTMDEQKLYDRLPVDGSAVGNKTLRSGLRWSEKRYWGVRDGLVDRGLASRGHGRGGSLRRSIESPASQDAEIIEVAEVKLIAPAASPPLIVLREIHLYEPLAQVLLESWGKDRRSIPAAVDIVAQQGKRQTGGRWSRPDIVTVEVRTYEYVPGKHLEITTFEVKPADQIDITAVYEALAHRRASTRAYVMLHVPAPLAVGLEAAVQQVRDVGASHGVGVVVFDDPCDYDTWDILEEAERFEPDPEKLNDFIVTQLPADTKSRIARLLR